MISTIKNKKAEKSLLTAVLVRQGEAQVSVWNSPYQDDDICIRGKI